MSARAKDRFLEIDVLRGFAALIVVVSHYLPHWQNFLGDIALVVPNEYGGYAVDLFFVISGFVIFLTLKKSDSVLDFAAARFSRLYPAYLATLVFATLTTTAVFGQTFWPGGFVVNLTMLQQFLGYPNFDNVYWSLTVELAFYFNVAWVLALGLHKFRQSLVLVWLLASLAFALTLYEPGPEMRHPIGLLFALDFAPFFSAGIVFFDAREHGWSRTRVGLLGLALVTESQLGGLAGAVVMLTVITVMALALRGHLRFSINRVTLWLGAISYTLYLIHRNVGYGILDWLHTSGVSAWPAIALTTGIVLALASAFTYLIERPALRGLRRLYSRWRAAHPQPKPSRQGSF